MPAPPTGRPYFVMELVRGIPITDYCDREQLSIPERLELFVLVCRAVQHAHQKGIIHRDLKPSNILVTLIDGAAVRRSSISASPRPPARLTERTLYTEFTQLIGTPLYMSPEQADLSGIDIDTRSDIYRLGVLLYELLTGTTPFDRRRSAKRPSTRSAGSSARRNRRSRATVELARRDAHDRLGESDRRSASERRSVASSTGS